MKHNPTDRLLVACAVVLGAAAWSVPAAAQPYDHLKCFAIRDPGTFSKATLDLDDIELGLDSGCRIRKKAVEFCIPVEKDVFEVVDGAVTPLAGQDHAFDRLCYKVKCPKPSVDRPARDFEDQFGRRSFEKFSVSRICTPAVKGPPPFCGNDIGEPGEECDGADAAACLEGCSVECKCLDCGDFSVDPPEECDPPASQGGEAGCRDDCRLSVCGDGLVEAGENCDPPANQGGDPLCNGNCTLSVCGDSAIHAGEECDPPASQGGGQFCKDDCTLSACGDGTIDTGEDCEQPTDCAGGEVCTAKCTCTDPQCPDQVALTLHAGTGLSSTATELDSGWMGLAHDADLLDEVFLTLAVCSSAGSGPSGCGESVVCGFDAGSENCRCSNDTTRLCGNVAQVDFASCGTGVTCSTNSDCRVCNVTTSTPCSDDGDCPVAEHCLAAPLDVTCASGQCVGKCSCLLSPPHPASAGNVPFCSVREFVRDISGTWNVDSGEAAVDVGIRQRIYSSTSIVDPCPSCVGDSGFDDGVRNGVCQGGQHDGAPCDADSLDATFPAYPNPPGGAYSYDCMPDPGKNSTGFGLPIDLTLTTGTQSLPAQTPCGVPPFLIETCPCGLCADDGHTACASNSDCGACTTNADCNLNGQERICDAAGRCSCVGSNVSPRTRPNGCAPGDSCIATGDEEGECETGPDDRFCDEIVRANGEGFLACVSDDDCTAAGLPGGNCELVKRRECFLDPIVATGAADSAAPTLAAAVCRGASRSAATNIAHGFPGPDRVRVSTSTTFRCAGDEGSSYPSCP